MEPIRLSAPCKDYLWGGNKLRTQFHKESPAKRVAESWELSCHPDGPSIVASGPDAGLTFAAYLQKHGGGLLGKNCRRFSSFPLLIKFIDAKENLSVQVHPDDAYALREEGQYGKTEMWYVLDAAPGAVLYYGLNLPATKALIREKIRDGSLMELLRPVRVKPGDVVFLQAGTLHAIGAGILVAEIQQNSNVTYRVFDYGRPRPLHVEKALEVARLQPEEREIAPTGTPEHLPGFVRTPLAACEYFTVTRLKVEQTAALSAGPESFHSLLCVEGEGVLESAQGGLPFRKGDSLFLPAGMGAYKLTGRCTLLLTTIP